MPLRDILIYPDPRLKRPSQKVENISDRTVSLVRDLFDTMYAAPGIGLAAPQIGVAERVMVLDVEYPENRKSPICLVNPEIILAEGDLPWEEGCLSVAGYTSIVRRSAYVKVRGIDLAGKEVEIEGEGLLAVALQHEIDHLEGRLFLDRISKLKRDLYTKRLLKGTRSGTSEQPDLMI